MKAFVRKEAVEMSWPVAVMFIAACWGWLAAQPMEGVLLAPKYDRGLTVAGIAVAAGALIAFVQFSAERWRGTLGFALHRSGGPSGMCAAKAIVGTAATMLIAIGPLFVFAGFHALFSPDAAIIQPQRLVEYSVFGLSGFSGYALGALASQLRRSWWLDSGVLVLGGLGVFALSVAPLWFLPASIPVALTTYLFVQVVMGAVLSRLALGLLQGARDREHSLPTGQMMTLAVVFVFLVLPPAAALIALASGLARQSVFIHFPAIARDREDGKFRVLERSSPDLVGRMSRGRDHKAMRQEPVADLVFWPETSSIRDREELEEITLHARSNSREFDFLPRWIPLWTEHMFTDFFTGERKFSALGFLDRQQGIVRVFWIHTRVHSQFSAQPADQFPPTLPLQRTFAKANDRPFSRSTFTTSLGSDMWCVIDPEDKTMWKITPTDFASTVSEMRLPDDDRLVRVERFYSRQGLRVGSYRQYGDMLLFVGENNEYIYIHARFEPYSRDLLAESIGGETPVPSSEADDQLGLQVRQTDFDPLEPTVEIRDPRGDKTLFSYTFRSPLSTAGLIMDALALCRPPIACANSLASPDGDNHGKTLAPLDVELTSEPLLAQGRRPWLLAMNAVLAALWAFSITRQMIRSGANLKLTVLVAGIVLLFGLIAYVYFRAIVPRRSRSLAAATPALEARELLIQSA
jgi:hypothetical protein